jgi:hypothetical protein
MSIRSSAVSCQGGQLSTNLRGEGDKAEGSAPGMSGAVERAGGSPERLGGEQAPGRQDKAAPAVHADEIKVSRRTLRLMKESSRRGLRAALLFASHLWNFMCWQESCHHPAREDGKVKDLQHSIGAGEKGVDPCGVHTWRTA